MDGLFSTFIGKWAAIHESLRTTPSPSIFSRLDIPVPGLWGKGDTLSHKGGPADILTRGRGPRLNNPPNVAACTHYKSAWTEGSEERPQTRPDCRRWGLPSSLEAVAERPAPSVAGGLTGSPELAANLAYAPASLRQIVLVAAINIQSFYFIFSNLTQVSRLAPALLSKRHVPNPRVPSYEKADRVQSRFAP